MDFVRRNYVHLAVIAAVLAVQVFAGDAVSMYYRFVLRPRFVTAGAQSCRDYRPLVLKEAPSSCDLVLVVADGNGMREIYESDRGRVRVTVSSSKGKWTVTESSYRANQASLLLPGLAFLMYAVALVHMVVRTRSLFWNFTTRRPDRVEEILLLYAIPVFLSGIIIPLMTK